MRYLVRPSRPYHFPHRDAPPPKKPAAPKDDSARREQEILRQAEQLAADYSGLS